VAVFDGTDACTTPVLSLREAPDYPHNVERGVFGGSTEHRLPNPAPRIGSEHARPLSGYTPPGADTTTILAELGLGSAEIEALIRGGAAS
jgi:alpha-methylacyl-CoA racemase